MMLGNTLANAACDYAEKEERLRGKCREMSEDYLQGRIDQYDESFVSYLPFGHLLEPQEIRIMKSVLEEKTRESN